MTPKSLRKIALALLTAAALPLMGTLPAQAQTWPDRTIRIVVGTAPSTPTAEWQSCGMKVRVQMPLPDFGGAIRHILGTTFFVTSPRFISGPSLRRMASSRALSSASTLSCSFVS